MLARFAKRIQIVKTLENVQRFQASNNVRNDPNLLQCGEKLRIASKIKFGRLSSATCFEFEKLACETRKDLRVHMYIFKCAILSRKEKNQGVWKQWRKIDEITKPGVSRDRNSAAHCTSPSRKGIFLASRPHGTKDWLEMTSRGILPI